MSDYDREPLPSDGPDYYAEYAAWSARRSTYDRDAMAAAYTSSSDRSTARAGAAVQEADLGLTDPNGRPPLPSVLVRVR